MTANQLRYWELQELRRSNLAKEGETNRSNVVREEETERHNRQNEIIDASDSLLSNGTKLITSVADLFTGPKIKVKKILD